MVEASFRWLLNHSSLSDGDGVVLGASSSEQLAQNLAGCATAEALPPAVVSAFDEAWKIGQEDAFAFWRGYSKDQPGWEDMDPGAASVLPLCAAVRRRKLTHPHRAAVVQVRREEVSEGWAIERARKKSQQLLHFLQHLLRAPHPAARVEPADALARRCHG